MISSILAPIFVFAVVVIVHEGGHFLMAKWTGMKVIEFAVGFGPVIVSKKWGETLYSLRLIPLGDSIRSPAWMIRIRMTHALSTSARHGQSCLSSWGRTLQCSSRPFDLHLRLQDRRL